MNSNLRVVRRRLRGGGVGGTGWAMPSVSSTNTSAWWSSAWAAASGPKAQVSCCSFPSLTAPSKVDLREQVREVPHQVSITKDNAPISIDFLWYYKVLDPTLSVVGVGNFELSAAGMATTTLRSVIGGIPLDDVLSQREHINQTLRTKLDEVTERWGVKVTNVEIREIIPPRDVQDAMNRQMSAERIRRAVVTESTGTREAAINVAEGEKQSAILKAEGEKQSNILEAEGEKQAQVLKAEGFSVALEKIFAGRQDHRPEDHDPAILRNPQECRRERLHQVHLPDGVHQHVGRFRQREREVKK